MCLRTLSNKQTFLVTCTFLKIQGSAFAEIYLHYLPLFSYLSSDRNQLFASIIIYFLLPYQSY